MPLFIGYDAACVVIAKTSAGWSDEADHCNVYHLENEGEWILKKDFLGYDGRGCTVALHRYLPEYLSNGLLHRCHQDDFQNA